jgi:hypothetical protein
LAGAVLVSACSDAASPGSPAQFSSQISIADLTNHLQGLAASEAARVELELPATGTVAREVKLKTVQEVDDEDQVESQITALALTADGGTLTLAPGFGVTFSASTQFEAAGVELTMQQFLDRVNGALAQVPPMLLPVEAKRTPVNPLALGPGDPLPAAKLELKSVPRLPQVEVNVTQDNLVSPGGPDCDAALLGCVKVLGLTIGIDASTELKENHEGIEEAEFEGVLDCATLTVAGPRQGSFTLPNGTVIQLDPAVVSIEAKDGHDGKLGDLAAVQAACTAGQKVKTEGEGVQIADNPVTFSATKVEFEVEDEQHQPGLVEFQGAVSAVNLTDRTVSIIDVSGPILVHVADDGLINVAGDLTTLDAVAAALSGATPQNVRAEGHAPASTGSFEATDVKFEVQN